MAKNAKLTDVAARSLKPDNNSLSDGVVTGLWLVSGSKQGRGRWVLRYVSPQTKKRRDMGFGSYPDVGIAEARSRAQKARVLISDGLDPIDARSAHRANLASAIAVMTFEAAAREYHKQQKSGWRNDKHAQQWIATLAKYVFPEIGNRAVDSLNINDFRSVLDPIWLTKSETASRVKQRCEAVMNWCCAQQLTNSNPLVGVNLLLSSMPSKRLRTKHHPSMPAQSLPKFVATVLRDGTTGSCREAIECLILSAVRSGELLKMTWDQLDLEQNIWTIPAEHMKSKIAHRVPLSSRMVEILSARLEGRSPLLLGSALVFPSPTGKVYSDMTLSKFLKDHHAQSDTPGKWAVPHGFRGTFRTWGAEQGLAEHHLESCLAHTVKDAVVAAYRKTDLLDQRAPIMQKWCDFVSGSAK